MRVTAPYDAYVPALVEPMLKADPLDPNAGFVKGGQTYDVPSDVAKSLNWESPGPSRSDKPRVDKGTKPAP